VHLHFAPAPDDVPIVNDNAVLRGVSRWTGKHSWVVVDDSNAKKTMTEITTCRISIRCNKLSFFNCFLHIVMN
jgi:hypothetical protein